MHALEDYIIEKYQPYVVDISKYFVPNEWDNSDVTPVHFEKNYNELLSNIIEQIILQQNKDQYYDCLSPLLVASLLERAVSNEDFVKIYQVRALPFVSNTLLDYFFQSKDIKEIAINRIWIASLYEKYETVQQQVKQEIEEKSLSKILYKILHDQECWKDKENNLFEQKVYEYLKEITLYLEFSVAELYDDFLDNLEKGLPKKWLLELKILSILAPTYKEVMFYLLQFYQATENHDALQKISFGQGMH